MASAVLTVTRSPLDAINHELARDPKLASANTQRGYRHDLAQFEAWRASRPMTKLLVEEYAAALQHAGKSPNSINRALAAVRWWARRLSDLAFEDRDLGREAREEISVQASRVIAVKDVKGTRVEKGRHIETGELSALMQTCAADGTAAGVRDAAIIALAYSTGLRRSELAGLNLADVRWTASDEADVIVHGKGDKTRKAFIYNGSAAALRDWLAVRGDEPGALFYPVNKAGKIITEKHSAGVKAGGTVEVEPIVSDEALAQMLAKRAEQAGVENLTWHDFRRTFAGSLLDNGTDLVTVQKLMGHSSPTTTSNYDRRPEDAKRRAVRGLHVPYRGRKAAAK